MFTPFSAMKSLRLLLLGVVVLAGFATRAQDAGTPATKPDVVVTPGAAAPAPARNIRFQFDGIPYSDVVERFSQMAGKPLLSDTNVVGTLTYDDPNAYNYNEALDTLNLMLAMKGVMLVEDGNNLRLVPFKQLPAMPLRIMRGMENVGDVRPNEVVTVVMDVKNLDAKEVADSVLPMLSNAGSVATLGRGRGLVVTDRLANIQRVRTLLETIGTEQAADRQMKTFTLLNASGAIVSDLLNRTFGIATAPKRTTYNPNSKAMEVLPADPNDYITSVYDEASRTLVLFGPNDRMELAEELINKFEQKGGSGDVRIFQLQSVKAEEMATMVRQAIPGVAAPNESGSAAATKARVIADAAQNRLIVAAPLPGQLDQIEQLVTRVDKGAVGAVGIGGENPLVPNRGQAIQLTKIFRPRATEATNVTTILKQALTRKDKGGQATTTASVSYDPGSQSVVVTGSPGDLQTATDIVAQLETGSSQPTPLQTRFIEVGSPEEARRIQPLVEQLYRNQTADGSASTVAHAKIMADTESGRLIVTASQDHLQRIEQLVTQLRADKPQTQTRRLKVIPLKNTRTDSALTQIQSLVTERMMDRRFATVPKPSLVSDAGNNRLLVTGTDEQMKEIEAVVGIVDIAPVQAERELGVIQLQAKAATEVIPLVTQLIGQMATQGLPAPTLMADPTGKQIIVLAVAKDQERIRTLVKQFDVTPASAAPRQFRGIELFSRTAAEFTPLVQQLYQEQIRGQPEPAGGPATLIAETKNNRIMVSGGDKEITRVEGIIRQLDPSEKKAAKEETRVIRLKTASASEIVGLVEKSLNAQTQTVKVLLDTRSNSLVVTGDHAAVEAAYQMIQQLDTRPDSGPRELRVIELKSADANTLAPTVNNLFTELLRDQRGADYVTSTKIVPDPVANRLIITGGAAEIEQVASIVNRLDNSPQQAPGARVFKLNQAEASMMAPIVSSAMMRYDARGLPIKRVTVTADEKSNSLIVSGTRTDLQDAESVIEKLDGGGEAVSREKQLRIFDVKGDPDAIATLIQKVFAAQNPGRNLNGVLSITPEPASKRLLVLASPTVLAQIETMVTALDAKPEQGVRELHAVELKNATAADLMAKVTQIYAEQSQGKTIKPATIYPDASGTRLLVQGTDEQAASIQQIVSTLESQARPTRETKTFDLGKLSEAQRLMPLVQQLYRDQLASSPQLGAPDAQIISDGKTGRIFVSARADQLKTVEDIISRLQLNSGNGQPSRETKTFEVGTAADVQRLQPLVQQLYQDQWRDKQDTDPADAQIMADARTGRLIVTGKPEHLKQIEAILQQLGTGKARTENRQTKIIDLTTASAVELAGTVRTLYTEEAKGRLGNQAPDTLITPDTGGNRLILVGDTNELAAVEEIVRKLDKASAQSASARVFKIKSADPAKVAEILTTSLVRYDAYGRPQKRATVSVDAKTRTLIVTGDPKELQGVSLIIEQLDQSLGEVPERKTKVITLKQGRAAIISPKVRQLYDDRIKSQPELSTSDILILEEGESNQLIIAGNDAQLKLVGEIVDGLQSAQVSRAARETRLLPVGSADELSRLQPLVQQLYTDRFKGRDASDPADAQIIPDAKNARFIVTARTNHITEIEEILAQLRSNDTAFQARDTRVFDLTTANAVELSSTVRTLYTEQAKNRPGAPAADTLITPDVSGNRIIVTGGTNELAVVEDLIRKLDKVGSQSASARVFKIKSAEPEKVAEILSTSLVRYDAYGRPQKRVTVSVDAKTRTLIVTGDPKELAGVSLIIEQLDQSLGEVPERKTKVINLKQGKAVVLSPKVRQLYADRIKSQPELTTSDILILEEAESNQLIIAGNDAQLKIVGQIVDELQSAQLTRAARETRLLEVGSADELSRLQPLVQQLYTDRFKGRDASDPADAQIISDTKNARFIVTARTNHITEIEEILAQLRSRDTAFQPRDTLVFDLTSANAVELATTVRTLYTEQAKNRPGAPAADTLITPDVSGNRIIVTGGTNELAVVEDIIRKLDKVGAQSSTARVFKVKSADPEKVAEILGTALVRYDAYGRAQKRVSVVTDPKTRTIIATGDAKELQAAAVIIEQLDSSLGVEAGRSMRVLPLKDRRASEITAKIRQVYLDQARNNPEFGTVEPLILDDALSNQLIVAGNEKQLNALAEITTLLQAGGTTGGRQSKVFPLERSSATTLAGMISQLYGRRTQNGDPAEWVLASAGGNERTLVVEARPAVLERIEQMVKEVDGAGPDGENVIQTVHLERGRAEDLAEAVNRVMTARGDSATTRRVSITPVAGANSLLLNGPTNAVQQVIDVIRGLDKEGGGSTDIEVRIYKLENGSAREVSSVLQQLLQSVSRNLFRPVRGQGGGGTDGEGGGRRNVQASVSVDERSNSLIISATAAHFKVVEKILPTLDKAPERSDRDVQFVWLRKAKAFDVSSKLDTLFEDRPRADRPVIEPDLTANSLTIIAKRGDIPQIQDLISRLDEQGKESAVQVRLRPLDRVAADQMAKMLESIYPQVSGTPLRLTDKVSPPAEKKEGDEPKAPEVVIAVDKAANALILSGPAQELDGVDRLVTELSLNFYGNESEFRLFPIKDADPVILARTLGELLRQDPVQVQQPGQPPQAIAAKQRITVVAEPRTRSVIVRARPTDFALMESLIKQLDNAGQMAQLDFRIVPLTNAPPEKLLPLVQQMVAQLSVTRPGDPVTVSVDSRGRGLVVIARDTMATQVEKLIQNLDRPAANVEAEVQIISLKKASAVQLAAVLQGMLRPGAAGETEEARELQEQVRRLKVRNGKGEAVLLDLTKPIRIATDPVGGGGGGNRLVLTSTPDNLQALAAIVELMDSVAVLDGVKVRFVQLEHADAAAVSQALAQVFSQGRILAVGPGGPGAQPAEQGKALVQPLNVAVDTRSNTLILSGQPDSLELAQKIVADMDRELFRYVTDVRLFRLKHASATRLLPLLQSVFLEGTAVPGTEGLSTQITRLRTLKDGGKPTINQTPKSRPALTIQADDQSNILIVAARSDNLPLIADVIDQLDIPSASGLETVRVYPLEHAEPAAVQKVLNDLFTGPRASSLRNEDRPVITVDARTGALIVAGNSKAFGVIEGLLKSLDQKLPFDLRDIAFIPLEHADVNVVAPTLQKLMDARVTQRATLNQGQADALKVIIMADQRSNALIVGGAREGFELVQNLAKQLDQAAPALSGRIRLVPMQYADARVVASTLGTLFEQRYAALRTADVQRNKPIILADTRSNSLLVAASQEDNRTLDDLLKRLDAKQDNPALTLTVIPLKLNDSTRVATMLESIFAARQRAQTLPGSQPLPSEQIKIETDPLNNALIISASKENLELIQGLLPKLDQEPTIAGGVFETFTLEFADAARVSTILKSLVDQGLYRPGRPASAPARGGNGGRDILSISVDPRSNTLIVSASPENLSIVREVVKKLDSKDMAANADVKLYALKNARASTLAVTFTQFFQAKRAADSIAVNANERSIPATVIADDRINSLIVTGGKEAFDLVGRMLPELDGDSVFSRLNFRIFPLKKATALKLQATLTPIFANRPPKVRGEPVDPITIIPDQWVNALLVGATVEDLSTVASLIEKLDSDPTETGIAIHVFPLAKADARRVATTVQGLFRENLPNQVLPITVSADERINAIVVSCGETDAKRIGELVQKLDTDQVAKVSEIKVFPLQFARAEALSAILNTALNTKPVPLNEQSPNAQSVLQFITRTDLGQELVTAALKESVLITPDPRMNSLIVSGPVDYMGLLEQIITRLDASSPQIAKIKVFSLQNADARQMADMLTQMFRMTPTGGSAAGQRSVQYTLVRNVSADAGSTEESLASATVGTAEQTALSVTVDPRTNSLLVGGTDHYVTLVSQLIETLDSSTAHERNSEVIRLKNSQAVDVAQAIRSFLDQERQKLVAALGVDAAAAAQRMMDQEVAVVAETTSNTLLLSANHRYFEQVRRLIDELDQAQPQVLIQVLLAEVTLDNATDLGVEWSHAGSKGDVAYGIGTDFGVADSLKSFGGFSSAVTGSDFSFLLRALKQQGRLEVLSRPQIVTADNKPATINIGQRVPLVDQSRLDAQNNLTTQFRYEDVGVNLTVTPKISPDGFVKMEIGTTNSSISTSTVEVNKGSSVPIINQRKASTTVSAQSGQTIIIGGLIASTDDKRVKKMPVLGEIPYLGALFRTSTTKRDRKELLIMMTPVVMENYQSKVKLSDPDEVLRRELDATNFKPLMKQGELQRNLLDPLYQTNRPSWRERSIPKTKAGSL